MKKKLISAKQQQTIINGAYDPRNWNFDKAAKQTIITSGLIIIGTILVVNNLKRSSGYQ